VLQLGDLLSDDDKQDYIDRHLKPGQVLYLFSTFTDPHKDKYLVLVHQDAEPLLFVINSRVSEFIRSQPDLLQSQIPLKVSDYAFLDHDSFLKCGQVITEFHEAAIRQQVEAQVGRLRGELNATTKADIIGVVQVAKTLSPNEKRLIIEALQGSP